MIRLSVQGTRWIATGSLRAEACSSFRELLLLAENSLDPVAPRVLDLSGVDSIDMPGVQVLAAFVATSPRHRIEAPSEAVRELLTRVGALTQLLKTS